MNRLKGRERRKHPRIESSLPVNIIANGYDFQTSTKNISCLGAYCKVSKYIPPFTKLAIGMELALGAEKTSIACSGVVVRTEDEKDGGFNIAIFFNDINNNQRKKLTQYINQFLPK
jgi:hypothetical protein